MTSLDSLSTDIKYIRKGLDEFKGMAREQFEHVKDKQDKTNGSVRDLREWRIKRLEEVKMEQVRIDAQEEKLKLIIRAVGIMACMLPFTVVEVRAYIAQFITLFI